MSPQKSVAFSCETVLGHSQYQLEGITGSPQPISPHGTEIGKMNFLNFVLRFGEGKTLRYTKQDPANTILMFSSHLDIGIILGNLKCGLEFYFGLDFETNNVCHRILESNRPTKVSVVFSGFSWVNPDTFLSHSRITLNLQKLFSFIFCVVGGGEVWWGRRA